MRLGVGVYFMASVIYIAWRCSIQEGLSSGDLLKQRIIFVCVHIIMSKIITPMVAYTANLW